jgi:hypothetical protein
MENPFTEDLGMPIYNVISAGNPNNMSIIKVGNKYYYYDRGYDVLAKSGSGLGSTNKYAVEIPKE